MLATACSNDEVVQVAEQSAVIGFSSFVNNSTRAEDITYNTLEDLRVWGVTSRGTEVEATEIFDGQLVTKGSAVAGTDYWTYNPARYWIVGNAYSFAALAPADATGIVKVEQDLSEEKITEAGLTITFSNKTANGETDLLYAKNDDVTAAVASQAAVSIDLKHMLSRVKFQFTNGFEAGETIVIEDLTINNSCAVAHISKASATGTWTAEENPEDFALNFGGASQNVVEEEVDGKVVETYEKTATTGHKYIIPLTAAKNYNISFTIKLMKGENMIAKYTHQNVPLGDINYKNNYSYIFKTTIDPSTIDPENPESKIEFVVNEFDGFTPETEENYNLPKKETPSED